MEPQTSPDVPEIAQAETPAHESILETKTTQEPASEDEIFNFVACVGFF